MDRLHPIQRKENQTMPSDMPDTVLSLLALPIPDFIQSSYSILLGRRADPHEVAARASVLRLGWGRLRLLENIVASSEFTARERQTLLDPNDQAFVEQSFLRYMNRMPDLEGLTHYTSRLGAGKSRAKVRRDIATSGEARASGSFWSELDRLLADERKRRHRFGRWFGFFRRSERRRNLELEILRKQDEVRLRAETERLAFAVHRETLDGTHQLSQSALAAAVPEGSGGIDGSTLPPDARRMLSRLQHFRGRTWLLEAPKQVSA